MRKITQYLQVAVLLCILMILSMQAFAQTAVTPAVGDGSENNPYQIVTLENLYWLTQSDSVWDKHFIQISDIDASATIEWDDSSGFTPIGKSTSKFTGSYNGKGNTIDGMYIKRPDEDCIGMFGYLNTWARVDSLGLLNLNVSGNNNVGGLVGASDIGYVTNCFTTGKLNGTAYVGGLVGINHGIIYFCYSNVYISATYSWVGGLVGSNSNLIQDCYSRSNVQAFSNYCGGLVGRSSSGNVESCFWDIEASDQNISDGGTGLTTIEMQDINTYLVAGWDFLNEIYNGTNDYWGINSAENGGYPFLSWQGYSSEDIECQAPLSAIDKIIFGDISDNSISIEEILNPGYGTVGYCIYINTEDSWTVPADGTKPVSDTLWQNAGQQCIYFGTSDNPKITVKGLSATSKYYFKVYAYNICSGIELYEQAGTGISQFTTPVGNGSENDPYIIANLNNLEWLMRNDSVWNKHFIQTADIDASASIERDDSSGFTPIGNTTIGFTGSYNGKGHAIDSIHINRSDEDAIGLFGSINGDAHIDSLGITNLNIHGSYYVGGLVGKNNYGYITNCYTNGICSAAVNAGGLVGYNSGEISNCNSNCDINASSNEIGGLVGKNDGDGVITNSYSTGNVTGNSYVGGLVGNNSNFIRLCYSNGEVNASSNEIGGLVGKNDIEGEITNSYSTGNVSGDSYVGGFVGHNYNLIQYCYSFSSVQANSIYGGLVGENNGGNIESSFWDIEISGQNISAGGTGLTTIEMQDIKTYLLAGWDFMDEVYNGTSDIWGHNSSENNGYPFLKWQGYLNTLECQAPLSPVGKIVLGDISSNSITIDSLLEPGYGSEGYSIYVNSDNNWVTPLDGSEPAVETQWQNNGQQCIYFSTSNNPNFAVTGLSQGTKYYFKVYSYNDCSGTEMYEQSGTDADEITAPEGDGSGGNPYYIASLLNLEWLMRNDTVWNKHFIQTEDIDASSSIDWDKGSGFTPIGNSTTEFTGNYNGNGYVIDQLYINRPADSLIGFFGNVGSSARIENLGLTNIDFTGGKYFGGLIGFLYDGQIKNCYITGTCANTYSDTPWAAVGGLVGFNDGKISLSYSDVDVSSAYDMTGGLVGVNADFISSSYSMGSVNGNDYTGGLIGVNLDMVFHCYSRSSVKANNSYCGGLIGDNYGYTVYCFWDTETSGQNTSVGGTGLETSEMQDINTYFNANWDFIDETVNGSDDYWGLNSNENDGYPFLYWQGFTNTAIITNSNNYVDNTDIRIYPNPVSNILNIEFGDKNAQRLTMLDILGKILIDKTIDTETEHIDITNFKPGIYIINIYKDKEVFIKKVIKK